MRKVIKFLIVILIILIIFKIISRVSKLPKLSSFSFPPNKCDLVFGSIRYGDYSTLAKDSCLFNLGREVQDLNFCKKISYAYDLKERCITFIAVNKKDPTICNQIELRTTGNRMYGINECLRQVERKRSLGD